MFGGIANDGTINALCSGTAVGLDVWMNYDSAGATFSMTTVKDLGENLKVAITFPAAVLDKDHSLCVETAETPDGAVKSKVWLKEAIGISDISFMTDEIVEIAELQKSPNTKKDGTKRLWAAINGACFLEKSRPVDANDRWYKPLSMNEDIIRLSEQGIAITSGDPTANVAMPPKLWRNGEYADLIDLVVVPASVNLTITKAIDLSSNGIILVEAIENGTIVTGILKPIP
jgi:hypothetical protein